jgi:hypothetical protein
VAGGRGKEPPRFEDVPKVGNGFDLGDACGRRRTREGTGDNLMAVNDSVFCRRSRDGKIGMAEFDRVGDDLALGVCIDKLEAAVGVYGWTNVESILGTKIPRASGCRFGMYEDPTTNWTQRHLVEIKGPLKEFPSTDLRVQSGLPKKIEGKFGLW